MDALLEMSIQYQQTVDSRPLSIERPLQGPLKGPVGGCGRKHIIAVVHTWSGGDGEGRRDGWSICVAHRRAGHQHRRWSRLCARGRGSGLWGLNIRAARRRTRASADCTCQTNCHMPSPVQCEEGDISKMTRRTLRDLATSTRLYPMRSIVSKRVSSCACTRTLTPTHVAILCSIPQPRDRDTVSLARTQS